MSPARARPGASRPERDAPTELARVATRRILVSSPTIRYRLGPGDRALVAPGDRVVPGMAILECTPDAELVDAGRLDEGRSARAEKGSTPRRSESLEPVWREQAGGPSAARSADGQMNVKTEGTIGRPIQDRRRPPFPGKWWIGGEERRGKPPKSKPAVRVGGTLLYQTSGRWFAAAGERHRVVESPVSGVVRDARNAVEVTIEVEGAAMQAALAAGQPSRGYLDVPRLTDGELWASALDVGRSGAVVVAGSRVSAQAISRARAMSIRGLIAGSVGESELRDLEASESRQRSSLAPPAPFGLLAMDGHGRRPLATPILALLAALAGQEVAIVTDPPLLVFDAARVPLPELPPDWVRARSGPHAGREGRWLRSVGLWRFRGGIYLEGAVVRFADETETTTLPLADLERFVF